VTKRRWLVLVLVASCAKKAGPPCERTQQAAIDAIELARGAVSTKVEKSMHEAAELATVMIDATRAADALTLALAELARRYGCGDTAVCCRTLPPLDGLPDAFHGVHAKFDGADAFETAAKKLVASPHGKEAAASCAAVNAAIEHARHAGMDELMSRSRDLDERAGQVGATSAVLRARLATLDAWRATVAAGHAATIPPAPLPGEPAEVVAARTLIVQCAAACAE